MCICVHVHVCVFVGKLVAFQDAEMRIGVPDTRDGQPFSGMGSLWSRKPSSVCTVSVYAHVSAVTVRVFAACSGCSKS